MARSITMLLQAATLCGCAPVMLAPHPRLILTPARLAAIQAALSNNTQAQRYYAALVAQGAHVLSSPVIPAPPANASEILWQARAVLTRVYVSGMLFRLTRNETYATAGVAELLSVTSWVNWNILGHALDTGELSHATAIGFDWLYDVLTPSQRAQIVAGLVRLSCEPFRAAYAAGVHAFSWVNSASNWATVTNGGAAIAALAIADEPGAPAWLPALLANATAGVNSSASTDAGYGGGWAPDGAWWEGPIYAGYAARYLVPFVSSLETATGSDAGFWALSGVGRAAGYQMRAMDPAFRYFNWADAEEGQETLAMLLAVADRVGDGAAAYTLRARLDAAAIPIADIDTGGQDAMEYAHSLLYWSAIGTAADRAALPLDAAFPAKKLALLRTSWTDPDAAFVGVKGCNCSWGHGDLDHGHFVYSVLGHRFVSDLGADSYGLPNYFGVDRFSYYRKGSLGHNTLRFGGPQPLQTYSDCEGYTPGPRHGGPSATYIDGFASRSGDAFLPAPPGHMLGACALGAGEQACVALNLSAAYGVTPYARPDHGVAAVSRRLGLSPNGTLVVSDRWTLTDGAAAAANATFSLHTFAAVTIAADARSARLELPAAGGGTVAVVVSLLPGGACPTAVFSASSIRLAPPQNPSEGLVRIDVLVDDWAPAACRTGLDVVIAPASS